MTNPHHSDIAGLARTAVMLLSQGRFDQAAMDYARLLAVRPSQAEDWFNYAYVLRCLRRFEPALDAYARALALEIDRPEDVHVNRAAILSDHMGNTDAAIRELEVALRINPSFAIAWLNLGQLHEDHGHRVQAKAAYEKVLEIEPAHGRALARIATIEQFCGETGRAVERLRAATQLALPIDDSIEVHFALGNVFDAVGSYEEAWTAFSTANGAARRTTPPAEAYARERQDQLVDALIATPRLSVATADAATPPLFICGLFRSGSTLAEQVLARHPNVTAGGELEALPALVAHRLSPYPATLSRVTPAELTELRSEYLKELRTTCPEAGMLSDKRPDNFLHIGLIKAIFPDAKIIHTRRCVLDNLLSIYFLNFAEGVRYGYDLDDIVHYIRSYQRLMAHWSSLYPDDIFDLDYDRLVAEPQPVVEALLRFCGLAWDDACLSQKPSEASVRTASNWQVRQPLHTRSSGRWRNYAPFLHDIREALNRE